VDTEELVRRQQEEIERLKRALAEAEARKHGVCPVLYSICPSWLRIILVFIPHLYLAKLTCCTDYSPPSFLEQQPRARHQPHNLNNWHPSRLHRRRSSWRLPPQHPDPLRCQ
jgi:hypothetical protein